MFAVYGKRELVKYGLLAAIGMIVCLVVGSQLWTPFYWFMIIPVLEYLFVCYFFRDPKREVPQDKDVLVSPADGVVTHIEECDDPGFIGGRAMRISIFLSVFDVHLNRSVFPGKVEYIKYKKGEFLNAMNHDSLHRNECNDVGFVTEDPRIPKYSLRQIAGLIARRIVCEAKEGQQMERGEIYGMMKFSSRTDLFYPIDTKIELDVKIGDKVHAGSDILGRLI